MRQNLGSKKRKNSKRVARQQQAAARHLPPRVRCARGRRERGGMSASGNVSGAPGFYNSGTVAPNVVVDGASTSKAGEEGDDLPELSSLAFTHWKVELQNRLIVDAEKRKKVERDAYRAAEDAKFQQRKQDLHAQVGRDFGNSKHMVEALHAENLMRGNEYKAELQSMKEIVVQEREEWAQFGHELTIQHGTEQAERTRARLAETTELKAEMGRQVRQEEQERDQEIARQRQKFIFHAKEHVQELKQDKIGKTDDAMRYALTQRKNKVASVQRTERKWKSLTKQERDNFLGHARDNHVANDDCKEHMREARRQLVIKNNQAAREERQRKEADAAVIVAKKQQAGKAKKTARDKIYAERGVSVENMALYRKFAKTPSPEKAARDAGLIAFLPDDPPSPYKLP